MALVTVSTLVQDVLSDIPEVPAFVAARQYVRAARELCEEGRVWREDISVDVEVGSPAINLVTLFPASTELVDIISVKPADGSTPVTPKTQAWLDINWTDWRDQTALKATHYTQENSDSLRFVPAPAEDVTDAYTVRVALKPAADAESIDDLVSNKYSELLISGAKAHLFMTPRKPWTDLQLAQYHRANFLSGLPKARSEATDEFQTGIARKVKYGGL